jgi:bacterioferritin-associated ferredoxin
VETVWRPCGDGVESPFRHAEHEVRLASVGLGSPNHRVVVSGEGGRRVIVCQCAVVNDVAIIAAVDDGATTLARVCAATGAGTDCGGCVRVVKALVVEHDVAKARTLDDLRALVDDKESIRAAR